MLHKQSQAVVQWIAIYHPLRVMIFSETTAPRAVAQHISSINGSRNKNNGTNGRLGNIVKDLGAQEDCIAFGKVVGFRSSYQIQGMHSQNVNLAPILRPPPCSETLSPETRNRTLRPNLLYIKDS